MANAGSSKKHMVVIYDDTWDRGIPYGVAPGKQLVMKSDEVVFRNTTDVKVTVQFPKGRTPFATNEFEIAANDRTPPLSVLADKNYGGYPYRAQCGPSGHEAEGSKPIIIIYD